jgi:hypothetical protein
MPVTMPVTITATGAAPAGTVGPAWADTSGKTEVVRNPLRVQDHVRRKVGDYVPGLTAVTAHARYYSLHPWVAAQAADAGLDDAGVADLLRRVEVTVAWASSHHESHHAELPAAHGRDALVRHISGGTLNLAAASQQGQYSPRRLGFLESAYSNPENTVGVLLAGPRAGPRFSSAARAGTGANLIGLLDTARANELTEGDGRDGAAAGWCVCCARLGDEGAWLRDLFAANLPGPSAMRGEDKTRRHTLELLARSIAHQGAGPPPADSTPEAEAGAEPTGTEAILRQALLFSGPLEQSPAAEGLVEFAEHWRGLLLRHYTVTAWRRLWADVVNTVAGGEGRSAGEIGAAISAACPDMSVGAFASILPPKTTGACCPPRSGRGPPTPVQRAMSPCSSSVADAPARSAPLPGRCSPATTVTSSAHGGLPPRSWPRRDDRCASGLRACASCCLYERSASGSPSSASVPWTGGPSFRPRCPSATGCGGRCTR